MKFDWITLAALGVAGTVGLVAMAIKTDQAHAAIVGGIITGCFALAQRRGDQ
jgi:transcriptional regulator GlxA family with amidase domain